MRIREMLNRTISVEKINEEKTSELWGREITDRKGQHIKWCYTDVLYSFKSMYLLGIKAFYPELVEVCGQTFRPANGASTRELAYNKKFLLNYVDKCDCLNGYSKLEEFIELYETIGNVIPVWPGANVHRGQFGCYDCPDIYFNDEKIKPHALSYYRDCPKSFMIGSEMIIDGSYKDITVSGLINMDKDEYEGYIQHAITVIKKRNEELQAVKDCD
ncbi:MAG: hypothetical protein NC419_06525 [Muribaculaceae bacterium]|nr:hypothetical protein [Muribaculaceae bacterium]